MPVFEGWPYPAAVSMLFVIVMLRANATYWLGRAVHRGAEATRARRLIEAPGFVRAERLVGRWGAPVVSLSFLTVGFQTLVNLAAGVTRMPLRRYLPAVIVGSVIWAFLYATVGLVTFAAFARLWAVSPVAAIVVAVVVVAGIVAFVVANVRRSGRGTDDADEGDSSDDRADRADRDADADVAAGDRRG